MTRIHPGCASRQRQIRTRINLESALFQQPQAGSDLSYRSESCCRSKRAGPDLQQGTRPNLGSDHRLVLRPTSEPPDLHQNHQTHIRIIRPTSEPPDPHQNHQTHIRTTRPTSEPSDPYENHQTHIRTIRLTSKPSEFRRSQKQVLLAQIPARKFNY